MACTLYFTDYETQYIGDIRPTNSGSTAILSDLITTLVT